ncbi:MAG: hypothetical protein QW514_04295 [Thermoprotei archaeon]
MAKFVLRVKLNFSAVAEAECLNKALLPDLVDVPQDLVFKQEVELRALVLTAEGESYNRIRSTIDEVLGHCDLLIRLKDVAQ